MKTKGIVIKPGKSSISIFKELWDYRDLFFFLSWKDVLVRYKQTVVGVAWSLIRPILTMIVFTIIFGKVAGLPSGSAAYPILVFAGMLPWQFFSNSLANSSASLINNSAMISKVYFPRIIIPCTSIIVSFVDFIISFFILVVLMVWYHFLPSWQVVFLPLFIVLAAFTSLGIGFWMSALNVRFRDFQYVIPFMVQFGLYISPVGFSSSVIPEKWRLLYSLNPMVGVIDGFRWSIIGGEYSLYLPGFVLSIATAVLLMVSGFLFFINQERSFADYI